MTSASDVSYTSIHVKGSIVKGGAGAFYTHTLANAQSSILEKGIARFDVLRRVDGPSPDSDEFLLVEVYRDGVAPDAHKLTAHYSAWREGVAAIMAQPRSAAKYSTLFPPARQWTTSPAAAAIEADLYAGALPWNSVPFATSSGSAGSGATGTPAYADRALLAVVVHVHVLPADAAAFEAMTLANCRASVREGGVTRFDFLRDLADPLHYVLLEVYNAPEAPAAHKATQHYATWAAAVAPMMAKPRSAERYASLYPPPLYWHSSATTHPGEGASADSDGSRGLACVAGQSFGFLSPRIAMGRGIAPAALKAAFKEHRISRPFIVTGRTGFLRYRALLDGVLGADYAHYAARYAVGAEPTVEDAVAATQLALAAGCDGVLGLGGGSAMDLGKAVSALMTNQGDVFDYMEVVGRGMSIKNAPAPFIAVPTTAGTGSEVSEHSRP